MKFLVRGSKPHVCPNCGSRQLRRSHKRGAEHLLSKILGIGPYRCDTCDHRHYRTRSQRSRASEVRAV